MDVGTGLLEHWETLHGESPQRGRSSLDSSRPGELISLRVTRSQSKQKLEDDSDAVSRRVTGSLSNQNMGDDDDAKIQQRPGRGGKKERRKFRNCFTPKEYDYYADKVAKSEGFDVGDHFPSGVIGPCGLLRPVVLKGHPEKLKLLKQNSEKALEVYNNDEGTRYKFVQVVKANAMYTMGFTRFITFQARVNPLDPLVNFQAEVHTFAKEVEVIMVRLERQIPTPQAQGYREISN